MSIQLNGGGDRPEAYPKPTETDTQLQNQPEYIDQQPNSFETDISDIPASANPERSNNEENNTAGTP
ncbi:MAG TPA: hypothetical protein VGB56_03970 [Flavisolibacter sp.]|jgi:hypothetical protein